MIIEWSREEDYGDLSHEGWFRGLKYDWLRFKDYVSFDGDQNLTKEGLEDLRLLSNMEPERFKLLQIVLVGQPELEEKLNCEDLRQLRQRIAIRRWIRPLTEEESRQYMDHRLNKVGSGIQKVFTSDAVSLSGRHAKGNPRDIHILCNKSFLIGYGLQRKKIDEKIVREVLFDLGMQMEK